MSEVIELGEDGEEIVRLRPVPGVLAFSPERAEEILSRFPGAKVARRNEQPALVVIAWASGETPMEAREGPGVFLVLQDEASGAQVVLTDRVAIEFPRGVTASQRDALLERHGLELVRASRAVPHRVVAKVAGASLERAIEMARKVRAPADGIKAHADLIHGVTRG